MNEGIELLVYRHTDLTTAVDTLPGRRQPKCLDELGVGAGSFLISTSDPKIVEDPTLLDYRNVIKVSVDGQIVGGFRIDHKVTKLLEQAGKKDEVYQVSGEGLLSVFSDAQVRPYGGLKTYSFDDRYFNYAAVTDAGSDWYVAADWPLATSLGVVYTQAWWPNSPTKDKWPESAHSKVHWIWGQAIANGAVPPGVNYFRHEFTATAVMDLIVYAIGDDNLELFLDGQKLGDYEWRSSSRSRDPIKAEIRVSAGDHVLSAKVENLERTSGDNPAGFVCAIYQLKADGTESLWHYTGNNSSAATTWRVNAYPTEPPTWSPGEILLTLMAEAEARGVRFVQWLNPTFTADLDSNGNPWPSELKFEWSFAVGEKLSSVISRFREVGIDTRIDPDTLDLIMTPPRGDDRTTDPNSVTFEIGKNLRRAQSDGRGKVANNLSVRTSEGWIIADDADSTNEYGTIEDTIEADVSAKMAQALAQTVFYQRSTPEEAATYDVSASHEKPWVDFFVGDWVLAPNEKGLRVPRQVVSMSVEESSSGIPMYNLEFDTIWQSNEQRLNNAINKTSGGGMGGSFANAGGGVPSVGQPVVVTPPSVYVEVPRAPTNLSATSEGYWDPTGVTTYSRITLNWAPVTLSVDGEEIIPNGYEVWVRDTSVIAEVWELMAFVTANSATMQPFIPYKTYGFKVRTITDTSMSNDSVVITHLAAGPEMPMAAPTTPVLSSNRGVLDIEWDGKLAGNEPPPQFRNVYAEVFEVGSAVPYAQMGMALSRGGGNIPISGLTVGKTYRVRLTAVDGVGIESPKSASAEIVLTGVDLGDLTQNVQDAIDAADDVALALREDFDDFYATEFTDLDLLFNDFYTNDFPLIEQKLVIADPTNYVIDPLFSRSEVTAVSGAMPVEGPWTGSTADSNISVIWSSQFKTPTLKMVADGTYKWIASGNSAVVEGNEYRLLFQLQNQLVSGKPTVALEWMDGAGTNVGTSYITTFNAGSGWELQTADVVAPAGATQTRLRFTLPSSATITSGTAYFGLPQLRRKNGGELLVDGSIASRHVQSNSIFSQHVVIGSIENTLPNGMGEAREAIGWASGLTWDIAQKPAGMAGSFRSTKGQGTYTATEEFIDVEPGSEHLVEIWMYADVPGSKIYVELRDENNTLIPNRVPEGYTFGEDSWGNSAYVMANADVLPEWRRYASIATVHATSTKMKVQGIYFNHANGVERNAQVWMLMRVRPRTGPELMVDGSILTRHLGAQVVDTPNLRARSVVAETVELRTLTGEHMGFHTLTGDEMELGTLTVNHVNAEFGRDLVLEGNSQIILALESAQSAEDTAAGVGGVVEEMRTYYKFGADGAEIVNPDSPYSLWLKSDSIAIMQGGKDGTPVSEWTGGQLRVNEFVGTTASLGNHQLSQYTGGTVMRSLS